MLGILGSSNYIDGKPVLSCSCKDVYKGIKGDILKKFNISLNKLITILLSNGLSPLYGIANPRWAHS